MSDASSDPGASVFALWPLRLGLAAVFIVYGWNKFTDLSRVEGMFETWGILVPELSAPLVAGVELLGGVALLLGVLPRLASLLLSIVMVTAIVTVKFNLGFQGGWAFDLALLAGLVTILVNGAGRPTVWSALGRPLNEVEDRVWAIERKGDSETPRRPTES